jgi:FMN-dependent NADH-azoreductase
MEKILFINACVRTNSRTLELAKYVLSKLQGDTEEVKLFDLNIPLLNKKGLEMRENASITKDYSSSEFFFVKQFAESDVIVIAAPYWDLMFPAVLKNYFENITVNGLTFDYGENGIPYGLCRAKRIIYVTTAGGPIIHNFGFDYVSTLAKCFYGIKDVQLVKAERLDIHGANVAQIIEDAKKSFKF